MAVSDILKHCDLLPLFSIFWFFGRGTVNGVSVLLLVSVHLSHFGAVFSLPLDVSVLTLVSVHPSCFGVAF